MKEYKITFNGQPVKISNHLDIPEEYKKKKARTGECAGSLTIKFEPNALYKRQQQTGRPRLVKVMPW